MTGGRVDSPCFNMFNQLLAWGLVVTAKSPSLSDPNVDPGQYTRPTKKGGVPSPKWSESPLTILKG